jgi:hypothetical protein
MSSFSRYTQNVSCWVGCNRAMPYPDASANAADGKALEERARRLRPIHQGAVDDGMNCAGARRRRVSALHKTRMAMRRGPNGTTSRIAGTAVGADYIFSPRTIAGFALAGGGAHFFVTNGGVRPKVRVLRNGALGGASRQLHAESRSGQKRAHPTVSGRPAHGCRRATNVARSQHYGKI